MVDPGFLLPIGLGCLGVLLISIGDKKMPKFLSDLLNVLMVLATFIVEVEFVGGDNASKKASAISKVKAVINQEGGIDFPKFVPDSVLDFILDKAVDALVFAMNNSGFFQKLGK